MEALFGGSACYSMLVHWRRDERTQHSRLDQLLAQCAGERMLCMGGRQQVLEGRALVGAGGGGGAEKGREGHNLFGGRGGGQVASSEARC